MNSVRVQNILTNRIIWLEGCVCDHQEDRELELGHVEIDDGDQGVGFVLPLDTASHHATKLSRTSLSCNEIMNTKHKMNV